MEQQTKKLSKVIFMQKTLLNRIHLTAFLFILIFSAATIFGQTSVKEEIKAFENGLLPAVLIKGKATKNLNLSERMKHYNVPGMSVAVVRNGKLLFAKGYGLADTKTGKKIDVNTLFQAGSISKPVAALAALKLVDEGKVDLDRNVNFYLKKWKVAENKFTKKEKVTLRRLLTHTAGMTVHGFPGYSQNVDFPERYKSFKMEKAIPRKFLLTTVPGTIWRYSGGGYTVMEQLVEDVSGMPFAVYLEKKILKPLGMKNSTYAQPLPKKWKKNVSAAFTGQGKLYKGLWHNYPEQAAAGLWTTPTDLAKYVIEIQKALAGKSNKILSTKIIKQMLTKDKNGWGLGPSLGGEGENLTFGHGGKNAGFTNNMRAFAYKGDAVILMTNADRGGALNSEAQRGISSLYKWNLFKSIIIDNVKLTQKQIDAIVGTYHYKRARRTTVTKLFAKDGKIFFKNLDNGSEVLLTPASELKLYDMSDGSPYEFKKNADGKVTGFVYQRRLSLEKVD